MILGVHVSKESILLDNADNKDTIEEAIIRDCDAFGLNAAQIMTHDSHRGTPLEINYNKVRAATENIALFVHTPYVSSAVWKVAQSDSNDGRIRKMHHHFEAASKLNASGLVLHILALYPDHATNIVHMLRKYAIQFKLPLLLEMQASPSDIDKTYETPEKINNLTTLIDKNEDRDTIEWWGWVLDTAHIWAGGVDIKSYDAMADYLNRIVFKKRIKLFHLNGSYHELNSGRDKHAIIFSSDDLIWRDVPPHDSGVRAVVEFANEHNIPIIMEINRGSEAATREAIRIIDSFKVTEKAPTTHNVTSAKTTLHNVTKK